MVSIPFLGTRGSRRTPWLVFTVGFWVCGPIFGLNPQERIPPAGGETGSEKKESPARLNPVIREYFKERYKDMTLLDSYVEDSKVFNKNLDRIIEHHTDEVKKNHVRLREERQSLALLLPPPGTPLFKGKSEHIKKHLKSILRLLGSLDGQLFYMRQALALDYRFDPPPAPETESYVGEKDLPIILSGLERLETAVDNFYFSYTPSISFQELAEEPIPLLIEKIRKLSDRVHKNL